jgi:hypothetical protein
MAFLKGRQARGSCRRAACTLTPGAHEGSADRINCLVSYVAVWAFFVHHQHIMWQAASLPQGECESGRSFCLAAVCLVPWPTLAALTVVQQQVSFVQLLLFMYFPCQAHTTTPQQRAAIIIQHSASIPLVTKFAWSDPVKEPIECSRTFGQTRSTGLAISHKLGAHSI